MRDSLIASTRYSRVDVAARRDADELVAARHEDLGPAVLRELADVRERQRRRAVASRRAAARARLGGGAKLRGANGSLLAPRADASALQLREIDVERARRLPRARGLRFDQLVGAAFRGR